MLPPPFQPHGAGADPGEEKLDPVRHVLLNFLAQIYTVLPSNRADYSKMGWVCRARDQYSVYYMLYYHEL
jgi:hypothetical protein